jgi:hypothetical protein
MERIETGPFEPAPQREGYWFAGVDPSALDRMKVAELVAAGDKGPLRIGNVEYNAGRWILHITDPEQAAAINRSLGELT